MTTAKLSVSVVLATYNGGRYLALQLSDIAAQSLLPAELVVCDDASSDDTLRIVADFATRAPFPVRTVRNPARRGYKANFMSGTEKCKSDLIAFCDQDDRWHPDKLERIVKHFADDDVQLVFHDASILIDDSRIGSTIYGAWREERTWRPLTAFPWMYSPGLTQVFRRSLCDFNHLWALSDDQNSDLEPLPHDRWFFFLASVMGSIRYLPEPLVEYRQHASNTYGLHGINPTRRVRFRKEIGRGAQAVARRARAAANRVKILELMASSNHPPADGRAIQGADAYRLFANRYRMRAAVYSGRSLFDRGRAFARLLRSGAYGRGIWRFGPLALAMDVTVGVLGLVRNGAAKATHLGADHSAPV